MSERRIPESPWRIGVDVGGTFTDLVLADATGGTWLAKVASVPADPSRGVLDCLERLAADLGLSTEMLLGQCSLFVHGSTVATNTMLEGKGARVGLITTQGFRDCLEIRRGLREDQWDHRAPYAPVLVPRYLRFGLPGRIDAQGNEHLPLDLQPLDEILRTFETEGVQAIAVALMNSFLNDEHERAVAEAIAARWPGAWVSASAAISPLMGEYERTATAVVNAALLPRITDYLNALETRLRALGLAHPVLMLQSNGGTTSVERVTSRPVNLLLSGPAAAVGALNLYRRAVDRALQDTSEHGNLISMEIGGTSCDVLLMANGEVATRDNVMIAGYHVSTPAIDIHTIGAGGGTIAGVDDAGLLFVGPEGAGASPGPACYGRGGARPTVTDAQLVLGRLRPGRSAGGTLDLDLQAARRAIAAYVAEPLGLTIEDAAIGIIDLLEQHLLHAVEYISIERGYAPRSFTLVAAGGAGPMHGASVARGLGGRRVYVPRAAGALCAIGMLEADIRQDFVQFMLGALDQTSPQSIVQVLTVLEERAVHVLGQDGYGLESIAIRRELDLQYQAQLWTIRVALPDGPIEPAVVRAEFEREYRRLYGHVQPDGTIMICAVRVTATAPTGAVQLAGGPLGADVPCGAQRRRVWHGGWGWLDTPVYAGHELRPGHRLGGPALVEEQTTTVLIGPEDALRVDEEGNFFIDLQAAAEQADPRASLDGPGRAVARAGQCAQPELDPVILALMQNRLDQISRHMGWVMTRTARSTIFSQSHDFSCFITTPDGTLVANADGIPIHTGGGGFAVRALLRRFAGRIRPGDVFVLSDPYVAGGNHLPDWVVARPIWVERDGGWVVAGFCCNRAHQSDIGGGLAGTYNPLATEIWHEGIRLPVLKLIDAGVVRDDLWELLLINSRTPELLDGDLRAMLGSTEIGAERIGALVDELGIAAFFAYLDGVLDHAERRMRAAIASLPDGLYKAEEHTDNDCFEKRDIAIRVALSVRGDSMHVDFSGTDPQIAGFKNSSLANTYSAVYLALSAFFDVSIPRNEGTYRSVQILAPEGSIVNARAPAPMTMNTVFVAHEIVHAVWRALGQAEPARACAGWGKTMHGHVAGNKSDGSTWVMYQWHAMGTPGATAERDGFAQMGHLITLGGLDLPNLEFHEQMYPVRYVRHEQRTDAAGAGARRGGTGVIYEADILEPCTWSFRAEGLDMPTGYGVCGGKTGAVGLEWIRPHQQARDGSEFIPPKYGVRKLGPARMIAHTPGGGGWGDPYERAPTAVLRDVRDGVLSIQAAQREYGVVISADGRSVDEDATKQRRAR